MASNERRNLLGFLAQPSSKDSSSTRQQNTTNDNKVTVLSKLILALEEADRDYLTPAEIFFTVSTFLMLGGYFAWAYQMYKDLCAEEERLLRIVSNNFGDEDTSGDGDSSSSSDREDDH